MALDAARPTALLALTLLLLLPPTALVALRAVRRGALPLRAWSAPALLSMALAGILAWTVDAGLTAASSVGFLVPVMMMGLTRGRPGALARASGAILALALLPLAPRLAAPQSASKAPAATSASASSAERPGGSPIPVRTSPRATVGGGATDSGGRPAAALDRSGRLEGGGSREARARGGERRHRHDDGAREGRRRRDDDHRRERTGKQDERREHR